VSDVSIHSVSITGNYPFGTHVINRICELLNTETLSLIASFSLDFSRDGRHLTYAIGVQLVGARVQAQRIDPDLLSGTFEGEVGLDQPLTAEEAKETARRILKHIRDQLVERTMRHQEAATAYGRLQSQLRQAYEAASTADGAPSGKPATGPCA
jgi:hypothetical protein